MASFFKPEIAICISLLIVSKLVLLREFHLVGCCLACMSIIALTVLNDGMLAVSVQCRCCQHFNICIYTYTFSSCGIFFVLLYSICSFGVIESILHIKLLG